MKAFSYTKTPYLLEAIEKTEQLRRTLILTPLSHSDVALFKWRALVDRLHYSFMLRGTVRDKKAIQELLSPTRPSHLTSVQKEMVQFKRAYDYLYYEWYVSPTAITMNSIHELNTYLTGTRLHMEDQELVFNLRYIQTNPDNPLIQAGIAYIVFLSQSDIVKQSPMLGYLMPLMFLYKAGYDYRQFLVLEEYFATHSDRYHMLVAQSIRDANVTSWLEFVIEATEYQLNKTMTAISTKDYTGDSTHAILDLNERQRAILASLDEPGSKISNKMIQKQYKISAITAARDLSKLSEFGYLFPIGKGRSTYYTKV